MSKPFCSIIIIASHEGETILDSLLGVDYLLSISEFSSELVLVLNNPDPDTKRVGEQFVKLVRDARVVETKGRGGYGAAVEEGLRSARGNIRFVGDPHSIVFLNEREKILPLFKEGYDMVLLYNRTVRKRKIMNRFIIPEALHEFQNYIPKAFCITEEFSELLLGKGSIQGRRSGVGELLLRAVLQKGKIKELLLSHCISNSTSGSAWEHLKILRDMRAMKKETDTKKA